MTSEEQRDQAELVSELLEPIPRTAIVPAVRAALGLPHGLTDRIVQAFDDFVAKPLAANLTKLHGRDLAKRNPMIYTVRGVESVEQWARQVLADKETSAIEAHIGTWLEEVARIVSGGIKPGSGSIFRSRTPTASCSCTRSSRRRIRRTPAAARATSRRYAAEPVRCAAIGSASS